ncbi:MAG: TonB-dependent receptor [Urechidicola sp.]|nr:TonB-dependent receptor [Urechidicola sp.]
MKNNLLKKMFFAAIMLTSSVIFAQTVSGTVSDANGPLPGASIVVKGTENGTTTDFDGNYTLDNVSSEDTLVISFLGFITQEIVAGSQSVIDVVLEEDAENLDEVIVTALGIKKTRASITYAAQDIKADELNRVKQSNPINSLSGKVAGLSITKSASGVGGSVKVVLRGNSSIGNNQPLYVVDGIPLSNPTAGQPTNTFGDINGGNVDGGDALSLINPDDIESMTVLKGASASALYGSAGLNGVILITTKKGKAGSFKVDFSSNLTVDSPAYMMDFNSEAEDNIDGFLETGYTNINSLAISGGSEKAQTFFSYSNSFADGVMPTNSLKQHTISVRETAKLFNDKLTVNASVMASTQKIKNRPISGLYFNPLVGVYSFDSPGEKLRDYEIFEEYDPGRNIMAQRWFRGTSDIEQNPYWITNRNASEDINNKFLGSLNLGYEINDWLSLTARGTYDKSMFQFERKIYATTEATLAPANGRYIVTEQDITQLYGDFLVNINKQLSEKVSLNAIVGTSTTRTTNESFVGDSGTNGGLQFANVFSYQNFNGNPSVNFTQNSLESRTNSVFVSATVGYADMLFLDVTGRNDWSSTLPSENNSFFYPSVGLTGVISEMTDLGDKISFAKVRASYAEVGSGFLPDQINPNRPIIFGGGGVGQDPIRPFPGSTPKPERQKSFEIGTEWRFLNNRYGIDIGYYNTKTTDQYYAFATSVAVIGAPQAYLNSGEISNQGVEATIYATPIQNDDFSWTSTLNFATNKNEIVKIYDGQQLDGLIEPEFFTLSPKGVNTFGSYLVEGGSFGDIYAQVVRRDSNGYPVVDNGTVVMDDDNLVDGLTKVGNANPDFTLGWNNSFNYKNFTLDFLIDGKFGGETMSMTEAIVEGISNNSARETANANVTVVDLNGNQSTLTAQEYYGKVGGRNGFTGEYVYSATNVRLAEFALGYNFNLGDDSFFRRIKASVVGSNLFFFYKDAPHDPNVSLSTGNALQGVDVLGLPSSRSIGLNINLTF